MQSAVAVRLESVHEHPTDQGSYAIYNARTDWENLAGRENLTVSAWGRNLNSKEYYTSGLCLYNSAGLTEAYVGDPRTYGVEVGYKFGK